MSVKYLIHSLIATVTLLTTSYVRGALDLGLHNDLDLTVFVTHPEIRAPLFQVDIFKPDLITPGYWFIAPYVSIEQERFARKYYQSCQTGPAIYDGDGDLVWTGACMFRNKNHCDFRLAEYNGSYSLSSIMMSGENNYKGHGVIMDSSYTVIKNVSAPKVTANINMHEFKLIHGGKSALLIINRPEYIEIDQELNSTLEFGWVLNQGVQEVRVETGEVLFEWWAYPEVRPQESKVRIQMLEGPPPRTWSCFHLNSIDKNPDGDYLVSSRFTDTLFKVSGKTGRLEWRLDGSGNRSDFLHQEKFNFSRQHDARWLEHSRDREIISFFDNAADTDNQTSAHSSVLVVELDKTTTPWVARVLRRWVRPDNSLSRLRANAQFLENGNLFTCWADNSYLSEHTPGGELLMTAAFRSKRFVTYRGYKFNFTGTPQEPPLLKASVYGTSPERSTTVSYVSWNGATDISSWSFYNVSNATGIAVHLGETWRTGFETSFQNDGYAPFVYAEALAADGTTLGRTPTYEVEPPRNWLLTSTTSEEHRVMRKMNEHLDVPPTAQQYNVQDEPNIMDSTGCSVYGSGCKPRTPHKYVYVVPSEHTEL